MHSEVYQLTPELERQLDDIEGAWPQKSGEYLRLEVVVQCAGVALTCLVYEVAETHIAGKAVIACGDWVNQSAQAD